jgi:hypothetical protein
MSASSLFNTPVQGYIGTQIVGSAFSNTLVTNAVFNNLSSMFLPVGTWVVYTQVGLIQNGANPQAVTSLILGVSSSSTAMNNFTEYISNNETITSTLIIKNNTYVINTEAGGSNLNFNLVANYANAATTIATVAANCSFIATKIA